MAATAATRVQPAPGTASPAARAGPDRRPVLAAAGIAKTYHAGLWPRRRQVPVLTDATLTLWPGEVVGLIGENGSGKSTLMKILVGALSRDAGTLQRPARLGFCPQEPVLYDALTCDEHFDLFGHAYRLAPAAIEQARAAIYEELGFARYARTRVAPSSTSASPSCRTRISCSWMSPMPASTGTPTSDSGSWWPSARRAIARS